MSHLRSNNKQPGITSCSQKFRKRQEPTAQKEAVIVAVKICLFVAQKNALLTLIYTNDKNACILAEHELPFGENKKDHNVANNNHVA
jgi:hypothetical protein